MFTDKLQNPFLKPSPFANSTANYTPSYSSANNFPPRYGSYKPYEQPRSSISSSNNQYPRYDHLYTAHAPRAFESKDIDTILSNNPFSREYKPSFGSSRAGRDLSPSGANNYNYDIPVASNYNYESYAPTNRNYETRPDPIQGRYSDNAGRVTPKKKYDNYLSTSSADSATTYINKIYQLDDDKPSANEVSKPLSNPFFRKNLLQNNTEPELPTNGYDSAALKYMGYRMEEKRERSPEPVSYENSYNPNRNDTKLNRGATFGGGYEQPYRGFLEEDSNRYGDQDYKKILNKHSAEDVLSDNRYKNPLLSKESRDPIESSLNYSPPITNYDIDIPQPRFGSTYQPYPSDYSKPKQPTSSKYLNSKDDYNKYSKDEYRTNNYQIQKEPYHYNLDEEYGRPSQKDLGYGSKHSNKYRQEENRVKFDEESQDGEKYRSYKEYQENFGTLGGNPYSSKPQQVSRQPRQQAYKQQQRYNPKQYEDGHSFGREAQGPPVKFSSSQVDEYTNPLDVQKKIKDTKYKKLGIEPQYQKPKSSTKLGDDEDRSRKSKGPSRDSSDYPKVLEVNGVLFHKIEVM